MKEIVEDIKPHPAAVAPAPLDPAIAAEIQVASHGGRGQIPERRMCRQNHQVVARSWPVAPRRGEQAGGHPAAGPQRVLAKRQPVLHVAKPVACLRVAGRPPEPDRQTKDQEQRGDARPGKHELLVSREDIGDHDRRDRAQAARDQHEHDQVNQKHRVKASRRMDSDPVGHHERAAQQKEAPARDRHRLGELVSENPVGRWRACSARMRPRGNGRGPCR